jgi:carboxyl-terminal processing protease
MFTGVLNQIRVNHPDSMDSHALIIAAIRGMLSEMDPHSYVLVSQPLVAEKLKELEAGRMVPVPISFRFIAGSPIVVGVTPGTEAARNDILPGDELVAIEGQAVTAVSVQELEVMLAGPKGSRLKLGLERTLTDGTRRPLEREVKREKPGDVTAVPTAFMLKEGTGYVKITTFESERAADDLRQALQRLENQNLVRLILDLRDNGGGSVKEAADVASTFLPSGQVIYIQEGRKAELTDTVKVKRSFWKNEKAYPIVVLVNAGTASASELVAGALQDHDRARIAGRPTFGKSLLMRPFPLPDGSVLWMVVGHLKTPCGRIIQRQYRGLTTREYYRTAAAARDTVGRPSCRTDAGRTVYGGGGIYPDVILDVSEARPLWAARVSESLLPVKWAGGYLTGHPQVLPAVEALAISPVMPAGSLEDFRRMAEQEGIHVPTGEEADRVLTRTLLPLLADAKWGEAGYYRISAVLDPEVLAALSIRE